MSGVIFVEPDNLVMLPPATLLVGLDLSSADISELEQQNVEEMVQMEQWAEKSCSV